LAHAIGVYRDLEAWGCDADICRAGMFHSIYGTERFQLFTLPLDRRPDLQALIGDRAERLAYLHCAMDRTFFDQNLKRENSCRFRDRFANVELELTPQDYHDLCVIQLCDWLEQVPRSREWNYRREAFERLAKRLGEKARAEHRRVYAQEAAQV